MARTNPIQFNVRSAFARARANELAKLTGMTATQVIEDALRGYVPPGVAITASGLVQRGPILVSPSKGRTITLAEAEAALDEVRGRDRED